MSKPSDKAASRRDFLKLATAAAPAAAAVALTGTKAQADAPVDENRMQDTAHTRAYFDSARF